MPQQAVVVHMTPIDMEMVDGDGVFYFGDEEVLGLVPPPTYDLFVQIVACFLNRIYLQANSAAPWRPPFAHWCHIVAALCSGLATRNAGASIVTALPFWTNPEGQPRFGIPRPILDRFEVYYPSMRGPPDRRVDRMANLCQQLGITSTMLAEEMEAVTLEFPQRSPNELRTYVPSFS